MWPFAKSKEYKLTPTQELLLALLRAQLWLKPVDDIVLPSTMEQWDDLLNLAYKQTVVCFIAVACLRHKEVESIPQDIREELEAVIEENKNIHEYHNEVLVELIMKFEEQGLHPVLLKGQGIAQMYPEPELRQCGDIDVYFCPEEYSLANTAITKFEESGIKDNKDTYLHSTTSYKGIDVELHKRTCFFRNPFVNKIFQQWGIESIKTTLSSKNVGYEIPICEPYYGAISLFTHFWHHFENGNVSLRQLCDVMMFIKSFQNEINSQIFIAYLRRYSLLRMWEETCTLFVAYLGLSSSMVKNVKQRKQENSLLMLQIILCGNGFFSTQNNKCEKEYTNRFETIVSSVKQRITNRITILNDVMRFYKLEGIQVLWRYAWKEKLYLYEKLCFIVDRT